MEIDATDTVAAETIEGLKRAPAEDAPTEAAPEDGGPGPEDGPGPEAAPEGGPGPEAAQDERALGVDPEQFDRAIGKLWIVGWAVAARALDEPELKEEREMLGEAADALGPVARKHVPAQMQQYGPEAIAMAWISGRIFSKIDVME